uniref:Uncharacterized protein n=1 Tax=Oryza meridionalis TaxID=40149 RepID=A0A0E0DRU1_9ORYZ
MVLGITSYLMLRTRPEPEYDDDEPTPIVVPMVIAFQPVYPNPLLVPVPAQGIGASQAPPPIQLQFAHPATLPPQGGWYGQAPNQQFAAPASAQGYYGWQAPNQQRFPCAQTDAVTHTRQGLGRLGRRMAGKMDKTTIIVSAVVGSLGLLSAILGFSAEGTKITVTDILFGGKCLYPENPATALGVCAAVFLLLAQITVSAVGGCCGCCKSRSIPSETKRIIGVICAVMSWWVAARDRPAAAEAEHRQGRDLEDE